jgi:ABC-type amino acid transport substrate-binding protein
VQWYIVGRGWSTQSGHRWGKVMLRRLLLVVLCSFTAINAVAAGLKVGISPDYPPMAYKLDGKVVGIEADNIKTVGTILGKQLTIVEMPFTNLIPSLESGEIDVIMSAMSITDERREQVLFTEPYMAMGQMAITLVEKAGRFSQPRALYQQGIRVGVEPGTTGASFAESALEGAQVSLFADSPAAFAGLRSKEIDVYIHDAPTSWLLATSRDNSDLISLYKPLTEENLAWAVRKDDARLAAMLNDALGAMKSKGTLRYILNRWIPVTVEVR